MVTPGRSKGRHVLSGGPRQSNGRHVSLSGSVRDGITLTSASSDRFDVVRDMAGDAPHLLFDLVNR